MTDTNLDSSERYDQIKRKFLLEGGIAFDEAIVAIDFCQHMFSERAISQNAAWPIILPILDSDDRFCIGVVLWEKRPEGELAKLVDEIESVVQACIKDAADEEANIIFVHPEPNGMVDKQAIEFAIDCTCDYIEDDHKNPEQEINLRYVPVIVFKTIEG